MNELMILMALLERATRWAELMRQAQDEERELTAEEIESFRDDDTRADQELEAAIAKAKSEGR